MNEFKCYLCKHGDYSVMAEADNIRFGCFGFDKKVVKCLDCGLVQLFPQWTEAELKDLYSKYWEKQDFPGQKKKVKISAYLDRYLEKGDTVLEIGCGWGDNLRRLRDKGFAVIGIDKDSAVCDGETILNYDIYDFQYGKKFDFIYGIHLLEHIPDPRSFISWLINNLKEKGSFVLELPNLDEPLRTLYKNKRFEKFYWYPYHLFFYNADSVKKLMAEYPQVKVEVGFVQEYGLINHLRWWLLGRPGNININIPVIDYLYKAMLTRMFGKSDTLIIVGKKMGEKKNV